MAMTAAMFLLPGACAAFQRSGYSYGSERDEATILSVVLVYPMVALGVAILARHRRSASLMRLSLLLALPMAVLGFTALAFSATGLFLMLYALLVAWIASSATRKGGNFNDNCTP